MGPEREQHKQPPASSRTTTPSATEAAQSFSAAESSPPKSFTSTAHFSFGGFCCKRFRMTDVFPDPRAPVITLQGMGSFMPVGIRLLRERLPDWMQPGAPSDTLNARIHRLRVRAHLSPRKYRKQHGTMLRYKRTVRIVPVYSLHTQVPQLLIPHAVSAFLASWLPRRLPA